jgi:hypothetical protein
VGFHILPSFSNTLLLQNAMHHITLLLQHAMHHLTTGGLKIDSKHKHSQPRKGNQHLFDKCAMLKEHSSINFDKSWFVVIKFNNILKTTKLLET